MPSKGVYKDRPPFINSGDRFSKLVVVGPGPRRANGRGNLYSLATWECLCDCGNRCFIPKGQLLNGGTRSCGCRNLERTASMGRANRTHGGSYSTEYSSWYSMIRRCTNPEDEFYADYGGRGITVCERWKQSFENFLADMKHKPSPKHTIERTDNNGSYCPDNCVWATSITQANNRRNNLFVEFGGRRQTIRMWARELNMNYGTLIGRLRLGWAPSELLSVKAGPFEGGASWQ